MTVPKEFSLFLHSEGRPLAEINPGSEEHALKPAAALKALDLLADTDIPILGGDVLNESLGKLRYTYENWYCERLPGESTRAFANRSRLVARQFIGKLDMRDEKNLLVVLVYTDP
jgi:hypothetical protein